MLLPVMLTAPLPIVGKACNSITAGCGRGCFGRHRLGTSHDNISWLLRPLTSNLLADPITLLPLLLQPLLPTPILVVARQVGTLIIGPFARQAACDSTDVVGWCFGWIFGCAGSFGQVEQRQLVW